MCVIGQRLLAAVVRRREGFPPHRLEARHGVRAADRQFHQHFNTGPEPARYLATGVGSLRYPTTLANRISLLGAGGDDKPAVSTSVKEGGDQIEYEDQDPRIHRIWLEEMRKNGAPPKMEKFIPTPEDMKTPAA